MTRVIKTSLTLEEAIQEAKIKVKETIQKIKEKRANNYIFIGELEHLAYCTLNDEFVNLFLTKTENYKELENIYKELKKEKKEREKRNAKRLLFIKELTPTIEKTIKTVQEIKNSEKYDYDKANECLKLMEDIKDLVVDNFNPDYDSKDEIETNATELEMSFMSLLHDIKEDVDCLYETTPQFAYNEYYGW